MIIRGAAPALQDSCDAPATGNLFTKQSSGISCTCGTKYETTRSLTSSLWKFGIHINYTAPETMVDLQPQQVQLSFINSC